jgi:S-DNA-T family DNA segregation ATPase FtsK/SpoIIIE
VAGKGKGRKGAKKGQADLEAIGLVLLALGVFVLGILVPALPTGDFGADLRGWLTDRSGWGAYALPWPLLALGGLFLLRRNPPRWPRVLLGYLTLTAGAWLLIALLRPELAGGWGEALRRTVAGAAGWFAVLPALLVVTLGIETMLGLRPTAISRLAAIRTVQGVRIAFKSAVAARRRAKARAAFHADIALERGKLAELDKDLRALSVLYPGSGELAKWRKAVQASRARLSDADEGTLEDVRMDVRAWQEAVADFARDRAVELSATLEAEGIAGFDEWARGLKAQLDDPLPGGGAAAAALDEARKAMALDLTALLERYRRLSRERDLTVGALREARPRDLERISKEHVRRVTAFAKVEEDGKSLSREADTLEGWRELSADLQALLAEFPDFAELGDYDRTLAAESKADRAAVLAKRAGWRQALEAVEGRAREALAAALAAERQAELEAAAAEEAARADEALLAEAAGEHDSITVEATGEAAVRVIGDPSSDAHGRAAVATSRRAAATVPDVPWELTDAQRAELAREEVQAGSTGVPVVGGIPIQLPGYDLLDVVKGGTRDDPAALAGEVRERVRKIDETLANFKLEGRVVSSVRGPTVTRFEVEPAPGEKISRFANLSDDLALAMAVGSVRIEAPIPGKSVIGLEVPNANRDLIRFRQAAETPAFRRAKARLPLILGQSIDGEMVVGDLAKMPHLLVAGSTGSGKSVAVNTLIGSLLYKFLPTELRFLMVDPKMVELTPFDGIPHLLRPVVTNPNDAAGVLLGAVAHMERRYKMMSRIGAKNLDQYNEKAKNLDMPQLPFIVIVIDELADLMITSPKEVESAIMRLAQMARATGMHLVLATQRPSVDILTSLIKVNVPARVAFAVSSGHDSRTILDTMGAERLVGMGDMLFYQPGLVKPVRLQGPFISENEIATLADFLRRQYFDDDFVEAYGDDFDPPSLHESDAEGLIDWNDDKLRAAAELVISEGQASVSRLQRRLQVGHARAGKLMDSLEALGVVGGHTGSKPRDVLVDMHELPDIFGK